MTTNKGVLLEIVKLVHINGNGMLTNNIQKEIAVKFPRIMPDIYVITIRINVLFIIFTTKALRH